MPLPADPRIETPGLVIRQVAAADLPALLAINGDPEVTRYLPYETWKNLADGEAWLKRMEGIVATGAATQLVVVERARDVPIGTVLLFRYEEDGASCELGYVLDRGCWGRGIMRRALAAVLRFSFDELGIRRFEAQVDARNVASAHLLERLGFVREGVLRQRWMQKGTLTDALIFGLLRSDWEAAAVSRQPAGTAPAR